MRWSHTLRPTTRESREQWPPRPEENHFGLDTGRATRPQMHNPKTSPQTPQSLPARLREANSRFLTNCSLFPAALLSARCPKLTQPSPAPMPATRGGVRSEPPQCAVQPRPAVNIERNQMLNFAPRLRHSMASSPDPGSGDRGPSPL